MTRPSAPPADLAPQLQAVCPEALEALRQLRASGAFVLGGPRRVVAQPAQEADVMERLMPVAGLFQGGRRMIAWLCRKLCSELNGGARLCLDFLMNVRACRRLSCQHVRCASSGLPAPWSRSNLWVTLVRASCLCRAARRGAGGRSRGAVPAQQRAARPGHRQRRAAVRRLPGGAALLGRVPSTRGTLRRLLQATCHVESAVYAKQQAQSAVCCVLKRRPGLAARSKCRH